MLATLNALKRRVHIDTDADDEQLTGFILAASTWAEQWTECNFVPRYAMIQHYGPILGAVEFTLESGLLETISIEDSTGSLTYTEHRRYGLVRSITLDKTYLKPQDRYLNITGWWVDGTTTTWVYRSTAAAIGAADQSITIDTGVVPQALNVIRVDDEMMQVTGVSGQVLTVERGYRGTAAAAHDAASSVGHWDVAADVQEAVLALSQFMYNNRDKAGTEVVQTLDGATTISYSAPSTIRNLLARYRYSDTGVAGW